MADTPKHVIPRDGSARLGGPRPDPPQRPSKTHEAPPAPKAFAGSYANDQSVVGRFPIDSKTFSEIGGEPSPRQLAQRARGGAPVESTTPKDLPPAPLG